MSSETGPSRKRPRVDEANLGNCGAEDAVLGHVPQKDIDVWLSDGNIVVIAAGEVAFRVHKSILSLRSEVFRGLFSLPDAGPAAADTIDGAPIVHVSDSPEDIRRLFLVICCGKNYYYNAGALVPVPFAVLASLIRMGHKYAIQDVLDDALFRLKKYYTDSFREWKDPAARTLYVTTTETDAPTVIELARLTNNPRLLPTAFLACTVLVSRSSDEEDTDGAARSAFASTFSLLAPPDQVRLVEATARLAHLCSARLLHLVGAVPCRGCTTRDTCTLVRERPLLVMHNDGDLLVPPACGADALEPVAETLWSALWMSFCEGCRLALEETDEELMRIAWNSLPELFRVDIDPDQWDSGAEGTDGPGAQ